MTVIPFLPSRYCVKKENARIAVKRNRTIHISILIAITIVLETIYYFVYPQLTELYEPINAELPSISRNAYYFTHSIAAFLIVLTIFLALSKFDFSKADSVAAKYKPGEMIETYKLIDTKQQWLIIALCGFTIAYIVLTIIFPIFSLLNRY